MRFRGREMNYVDYGMKIINQFADSCNQFGIIEKKPLLDGNNIIMIIGPAK